MVILPIKEPLRWLSKTGDQGVLLTSCSVDELAGKENDAFRRYALARLTLLLAVSLTSDSMPLTPTTKRRSGSLSVLVSLSLSLSLFSHLVISIYVVFL